MDQYTYIWQQLDQLNKENNNENNNDNINLKISNNICKNCNSTNLSNYDEDLVCNECGFVVDTFKLTGTIYTTDQANVYVQNNSYNNSINKLQKWMMYNNEEKSQHKLKKYTEELCNKLEIEKLLLPFIFKTVVDVMEIIKENEGTKRARVKDGIIIVCIQYISRNFQKNYDSVSLARKIDLNIKYISKAEKIILPLIHSNKIKFDKANFLQTEHPFFFIDQVISKYNLNIPKDILCQVRHLIDLCSKYDLLLDHTPQSIGICCFYYILRLNNIELDIKLFIEIYKISMVTLLKTYTKLNNYTLLFEKESIIALK